MFRCTLCDTPIEDIESESCPECHADPITGAIDVETVTFLAELRRDNEKAMHDEEGNKLPLFFQSGRVRAGLFTDSVARAMGVSEDEMDLVADNETAREDVLV